MQTFPQLTRLRTLRLGYDMGDNTQDVGDIVAVLPASLQDLRWSIGVEPELLEVLGVDDERLEQLEESDTDSEQG